MEPDIVRVTFRKQYYPNAFCNFGPTRYEVKVKIDNETVSVRDIPLVCSPADSAFEAIWRHLKHNIKMALSSRVEKKLKKLYETSNGEEQNDRQYDQENRRYTALE